MNQPLTPSPYLSDLEEVRHSSGFDNDFMRRFYQDRDDVVSRLNAHRVRFLPGDAPVTAHGGHADKRNRRKSLQSSLSPSAVAARARASESWVNAVNHDEPFLNNPALNQSFLWSEFDCPYLLSRSGLNLMIDPLWSPLDYQSNRGKERDCEEEHVTARKKALQILSVPHFTGLRMREGLSVAYFVVSFPCAVTPGEAACVAERYLERVGLSSVKSLAVLSLQNHYPVVHIAACRMVDLLGVWSCFGVDRALALEAELMHHQLGTTPPPPMVARSLQSKRGEYRASSGSLKANYKYPGDREVDIACQGIDCARRRMPSGSFRFAPVCGPGIARMVGLRNPEEFLDDVWT